MKNNQTDVRYMIQKNSTHYTKNLPQLSEVQVLILQENVLHDLFLFYLPLLDCQCVSSILLLKPVLETVLAPI